MLRNHQYYSRAQAASSKGANLFLCIGGRSLRHCSFIENGNETNRDKETATGRPSLSVLLIAAAARSAQTSQAAFVV